MENQFRLDSGHFSSELVPSLVGTALCSLMTLSKNQTLALQLPQGIVYLFMYFMLVMVVYVTPFCRLFDHAQNLTLHLNLEALLTSILLYIMLILAQYF